MFHGAILQPNVVRSQQLIVVLKPRTITTMSSKEKEDFAARMNEVADDLGIPEKGKNRQKSLGTRFDVSQEAARKWLSGEGFPSTDKCIEIVKAAGVNYDWFMTGRGTKKYSSNTIPENVKEWLIKNVTNIASVTPTDKAVDPPKAEPLKLKKPSAKRNHLDPSRMIEERRKKSIPVKRERRIFKENR